MLDLEPAAEHLAVAEVSRNIGLELLSPAARDAEAARAVPAAVWKSLLESGLTVPVPEERGGGGVPDTLTQMIAIENLAYGDPGIALASAWSGGAAFLLGRHASADHDDLITALVSDQDARGSIALYEGFGRAPSEFATTVTVQSDGSVKVVGRKVGVPFAAEAANLIVVGSDAATGKLRAVIVASGTPGVLVEANPGNLALDAAGTASVSFDVSVPAANLVGGADADSQALAGTVERIRLVTAAVQIGMAQRAIDYASNYAVDRIAFGRPISSFQGISFPLAEAQMRVAELRLELSEVATGLENEPFSDHSVAVTRLVNYAGEVASESTRNAVQTLGGHGFIIDHPVELWYRSAAALAALDFDLNHSSFQAAL
jgi:alkylation response protein AidB-like acyl-CoA dehydrogenase